MKKRKIILVITIIMIFFVIMGTTYSLLSYVKVGNQNYVAITGDIYMNTKKVATEDFINSYFTYDEATKTLTIG